MLAAAGRGVLFATLLALCGARAEQVSTSGSGASSSSGEQRRDVIRFRNGDSLTGVFQSLAGSTAVQWRHPDAEEAVEFRRNWVSEILLRATPPPPDAPPPTCIVKFNNGDELAGRLVRYGRDDIELETWYAGKLTLPRKFIRMIVPRSLPQPAIYSGPDGLDGWTLGKITANVDAGQWQYRNGAFYASKAASIARDVQLPDLGILEFDLSWRGLFDLAVALYTDQLQPINLLNKEAGPDFAGFYSLRLNNYIANLMPITKPDPIRYLGQTPVQRLLEEKQTVRIQVCLNKPRRTIGLVIDGVLATNWFDAQGFVGQGTAIRIVHQGQGISKISGLVVRPWDGTFDEPPTNPPDSRTDLVKLRNDDRVTGTVENIADGTLTMQMAERTLDIPLNRVKQIELAGFRSQPLAQPAGATRAFFHDGGRLTLELRAFDGKVFEVASPAFNRAGVDRSAFVHLDLVPRPAEGARTRRARQEILTFE